MPRQGREGEARTKDGGASPLPHPGPSTILVVDDSPAEREAIAGLFRGQADLRVVFADGEADGLAAVGREAPDLIVTDLASPGAGGLELVRRIRERHPAIPLVLMTGPGSGEAAVKGLGVGAASYLPKDDLADDLVDLVRQVLTATALDLRRRALLRCLRSWEAAFELENDPELVAGLIQMIQEELDGLACLDRTSRIRVGVALQEALTNALYHGNLEVDSELRQDDEKVFYQLAEARRQVEPYRSRRIRVRVRLDLHSATFVIEDEGPGFDASRLARPVEPTDLSRIGGRGLILIRSFMDQVAYNEAGNAITMVKHFRAKGFGRG